MVSFIWAGKSPRVAKNILYLPLSSGGLALPNFLMYYWAAVLVTVRWWFAQPQLNPAVTLESAILGSYAALSNLPYRGVKAGAEVTGPMRATIQVWRSSRAALLGGSSITPLWANPMLPHLLTIPDPASWAKKGIVKLKHVIRREGIISFRELRLGHALPQTFLFRYRQLHHALRAQFPSQVTLEPDPIERVLISGMLDKPLSTLYMHLTVAHDVKTNRLMAKWQADIPSLGEEESEECLTTFIPSMIAARDRFVQLKFLHRAYYTPQRLANIYPGLSPSCNRCGVEVGSFFHTVWSCIKLCPYWTSVADILGNICGIKIPLNPLTMLLSHLDDIEGDRYIKLCLTYSLFYARREILLRWKQ